MQLSHYTTNFKKHTFPITIVCDNVVNAPNIGSLFRLADAFGIEELVFCGDDISLGKRMKRTSRSTEKYVNYRIESDIHGVISNLKEKQYQILALEITNSSHPLSELKVNNNQPIAMIVGNENFGISESVLKKVDQTVHITMYGNNSSMNVVQATAIGLYVLTKQMI